MKIAELQAQIEREEAELAKKKAALEQLKIEATKPLSIKVTSLDMPYETIRFKLSRFDDVLVDHLRLIKSRNYLPSTQENVITFADYKALDDIAFKLSIDIDWGKYKDLVIEYLTTPALTITVKNTATLTLSPGPRERGLYLPELDSLKQVTNSRTWELSTAEIYRLPDALEKRFSGKQVTWSAEALALLEEAKSKRNAIESIATAETVNWDSGNEVIDNALRPFQKVGAAFVEAANGRALLAFDMGLGKSVTALAIAEKHQHRTFIMCPTHLTTNWCREVYKWTGKHARLLSGTTPSGIDVDDLVGQKYQYYVIGYSVIGRGDRDKDTGISVMPWVELAKFSNLDVVIIDEAHHARNMDTQKSRGILQTALAVEKRIALSGSPVVNKPTDLFPILHVLDPHTFKSYGRFESDFTAGKYGVKSVNKLHTMLQPYVLRKLKKEVLKDLPDISRIRVVHELSEQARIHYNTAMQGLYISLLQPDRQKNINNILVQLLRLKQITAADKINTTISLAEDAREETGKKVIIFSQFREVIAALEYKLKNALTITGDHNREQKYAIMDRFQEDSQVDYLIMSKVGSEGVTLTAADTVIANDLCWTMEDHKQIESRCYGRLNDVHGANSYYILANADIDSILMNILEAKGAMANLVVDKIRADEEEKSVVELLIQGLLELKPA